MTDKQIIIHGVDVSGCSYYADGKCTNSHMIQSNCKNVAVCYYKEYKRKEQECEELKKDLTDLSKIIDCKNGTILTFKEQLDQLKKENELYKQSHKTEQDRRRAFEQTLEEIREIAKYILESDTEKWNGTEPFEKADEIIEKINEVIDE